MIVSSKHPLKGTPRPLTEDQRFIRDLGYPHEWKYSSLDIEAEIAGIWYPNTRPTANSTDEEILAWGKKFNKRLRAAIADPGTY